MPKEAKYPSEEQDRFIVRMPDGMRERIAAIAKENSRSMNAEIVRVLEEAFPPEPSPAQLEESIAELLRFASRSGGSPNRRVSRRALLNQLAEFRRQLSDETKESTE